MCCLQDTAPEAAVAAEEEIAAGNVAEQTPEDAAAAGEHLAEHIQVGHKYTRLALQIPELCLSPIQHLQSHQRVMVRAADQEYMASVLAISLEPGGDWRAESESVCLCACVSGCSRTVNVIHLGKAHGRPLLPTCKIAVCLCSLQLELKHQHLGSSPARMQAPMQQRRLQEKLVWWGVSRRSAGALCAACCTRTTLAQLALARERRTVKVRQVMRTRQ